MGPRSGERGNLRLHQLFQRQTRKLQWGRALVSAEIQRAAGNSAASARLQWGRALVSAEIIDKLELASAPRLASMGPRSGERGNQGISSLRTSMGTRFNGA